MTSPSSNTYEFTAADSSSNQAIFLLQPDGDCGITTSLGAGPETTLTLDPNGVVALVAGNNSGTTASVIGNVAGSAEQIIADAASGAVDGNVTISPSQVSAITNGGTASEQSVRHDVGYSNTVNPQGGPNNNYSALSNNQVAYYSGIALFTDALTNLNKAQCTIPFPIPGGTTVSNLRVDGVIICKCVVAAGSPPPHVGDFYFQKGTSTWVNKSGVLTPANSTTSGTEAVWRTVDEQGTVSGGSYVLQAVVTIAASGSNLELTVGSGPFPSWGQTVVEIYATVYYN